MDIIIGADRQWASVQFVALIGDARVMRAGSLAELAQLLYALGVDERVIHLAPPDDGDHAMSLTEHAEFRVAWMLATASGRTGAP